MNKLDFLDKKLAQYDKVKNPFPIEVFPESIKEIILETNRVSNFPIDFTAGGMLVAAAMAIGNSCQADASGWTHPATLYMAVVGGAGTNKTSPLKFAMAPIDKRDKMMLLEYKKKLKEYQQIQKESEGKAEISEPRYECTILKDFTIEALYQVHSDNPRGIGVFADELQGFLNNMGRYNSGSELENWLEIWSANSIKIARKMAGITILDKPHIPVIGGIQRKLLSNLASGKKADNGFLDRFLFLMPENLIIERLTFQRLNDYYPENWQRIINNIFSIPCATDSTGSPTSKLLPLTGKAIKAYRDWHEKERILANTSDSDKQQSIFAKIAQYGFRFALILELLNWAQGDEMEGNTIPKSISLKSVEGAIKLCDYFKYNAHEVNDIVENPQPSDLIEGKKLRFYQSLPEEFTRAEAEEVAHSLKLSGSSVSRLLRSRDLFEKVDHGKYIKT